MRRLTTKRALATVAGLAACMLPAIGVLAALEPSVTISQSNRRFNPGEVSIDKSTALVIVNDDGDLLHHAYVESEEFNFDSGDQKPGSRVTIKFPVTGDFKVLCGIHPKMKLVVHVH